MCTVPYDDRPSLLRIHFQKADVDFLAGMRYDLPKEVTQENLLLPGILGVQHTRRRIATVFDSYIQ